MNVFLEIKGIKNTSAKERAESKSSKVSTLRSKKVRYVYFSDLQVQENQHFLTS